MANPMYLAMTAAEFLTCEKKPSHIAWMACHFSPYGRGISNIPKKLPEGSVLMLNDRIEPTAHDAPLVAMELAEAAQMHRCAAVILDFQRPGSGLTEHIIHAVLDGLPCPAIVSHHYAKGLQCGVLLPLPPMQCDFLSYLADWKDQEIWLDVYDQWEQIRILADKTETNHDAPDMIPELPHYDKQSFCRYRLDIADDSTTFTLHRGIVELEKIKTPELHFIGLWQDYRSRFAQ